MAPPSFYYRDAVGEDESGKCYICQVEVDAGDRIECHICTFLAHVECLAQARLYEPQVSVHKCGCGLMVAKARLPIQRGDEFEEPDFEAMIGANAESYNDRGRFRYEGDGPRRIMLEMHPENARELIEDLELKRQLGGTFDEAWNGLYIDTSPTTKQGHRGVIGMTPREAHLRKIKILYFWQRKDGLLTDTVIAACKMAYSQEIEDASTTSLLA
ncbi:uncharacterized protein BKA78DRAFT_298812 [Phyllosticta capitalensis]|uniref:uncharacterized protein n=1 Tax=Phyllosticta capitalensis TaxID=121624 RepID=UPI00312D3544